MSTYTPREFRAEPCKRMGGFVIFTGEQVARILASIDALDRARAVIAGQNQQIGALTRERDDARATNYRQAVALTLGGQ